MDEDTKIKETESEILKQINTEKELNWIEKIAYKKMVKQQKKMIKKLVQKTENNKEKEAKLKSKVSTSILEFKEFADIIIDQHDDNETPIISEKGERIEIEATREELMKLPLKTLISTWENILNEIQEQVR